MTNSPGILFRSGKVAVYNEHEVFNPDVHDIAFLADKKYIVPAIGSIVIRNTEFTSDYSIYIVDDVIDLRSQLVPLRISLDGGSMDRVLSYGNELLMMYYDTSVTPTRIVVDAKLFILGNDATHYRIRRGDDVISVRYNEHGIPVGELIDIELHPVEGYKVLPPCHTTLNVNTGDVYTLDIFNADGVSITEMRLLSRESLHLDELTLGGNPITAMDIHMNQQDMLGDGIIYHNQNLEDLNIFPELAFSDGTRISLQINNENTFVYGLDDISPRIPYMEYTVLVKHFLADNYPSTVVTERGSTRYIQREKIVRVMPRATGGIYRISTVPIWDSANSQWTLKFFAYFETRNSIVDVTDDVVISGAVFDGRDFVNQQDMNVSYTYPNSDGNSEVFIQAVSVLLKDKTDREPWLLDAAGNMQTAYGKFDNIFTRPCIDLNVSNATMQIDVERFKDTDEFLINFYSNANPPYVQSTEVSAPTPTHFIVRDLNMNVISPEIVLDDYSASFPITGGSPGDTVIVEFQLEVGNSMSVLYGVPVEVSNI